MVDEDAVRVSSADSSDAARRLQIANAHRNPRDVEDFILQTKRESYFMVDEYDAANLAASLELKPSAREPVVYEYIVAQIGAGVGAITTDTDQDNSQSSVAAAGIVATIPAVVGATGFITGFEVTGAGATAASTIVITVTGILGGTKTYRLGIPAGVTIGVTPLIVEFVRPIPASGPNVAIVVNVPTFGAGNVQASVTAHGFTRVTTAATMPQPPADAGTILIGRRRFYIPVGITSFPIKMRVYENERRILMTGTPEVPGATSALFFEMTGKIYSQRTI